MLLRIVCFAMLSFSLSLGEQRAEGQEPRFDETQAVQTRTLYDGSVSFRTQGTTATVRVKLEDWVVRNRQQVQFPEGGMLVVEMRAGGRTTSIVNGQRVERQDGDYFDIRAGDSLSLETGNDTVVLTVLLINR